MPETKKVLIIDDDEGITSLLGRAYQRTSRYEIKIAHDGAEGLALVDSWIPDLILLDLSMPVLKGAGVFGALRTDAGHLRIPVIVITGQSGMEDIYERFGALFFKKPFDVESLIRKSDQLLFSGEDKAPASPSQPGSASSAGHDSSEHTQNSKKDLTSLDSPGKTPVDVKYKPKVKAVRDDGLPLNEGRGLKKKILLAENKSDFAANASLLFESAGYDVTVVERAKDVFAKIIELDPDVLVIKFELPDQRGDQVILNLREKGRHQHMILYTLSEHRKVEKLALNSILQNTYYKSGLAQVVETTEAQALLNKVNSLFRR